MKQTQLQKITIFTIVSITLLIGQVNLGPRSIGTAGTFATQSRGDDVIGWNPANLGLTDNPEFSMSFGVIPLVPFPGINITNSSLSINWLNDGLFSGKYLTDSDKADILKAFPSDGLSFDQVIGLKFLGISTNNFAFSISAEVNSNINLPKELMDMLLFGILFDTPISLNDLDVSAQAVVPFSFAYGFESDVPFLSNIVQKNYFGLGFKVLWGIGHGEITKFEGDFTSHYNKVIGTGHGETKYAASGLGLAFDAGWTGIINEKTKINIALNNLLGFINWSDKHAKKGVFTLDAEVIVQEEMEETFDELEELQSDTVISIPGYRTAYPAYLMTGFQYDVNPEFSLFVNYRQHFSDHFNYNTTPRLSGALTYNPAGWMPLRLGISVGGYEGFQWGTGFGFHGSRYQFDFGVAQDGGFFNSARGFAFSIGQKLIF
ncbi:DUF5723 family protein [Candidatus Neomarinimicrobiota bacterium]